MHGNSQINGSEPIHAIFNIITLCPQFSDFYLRVSEKNILNELNKSKSKHIIRYPIGNSIQNLANKISWYVYVYLYIISSHTQLFIRLNSSLLQALLGNLDIKDESLRTEAFRILRVADGISKCLIEYVHSRHYAGGNFQALVSCVVVARSFQAVMWENSPYVSKQLAGMDSALASILCKRGKTSIQSILESESAELEYVSPHCCTWI